MAIGLLSSGYFITKHKPPPKYLFFWNVVLGVFSMCAFISYTQLGCGSNSNLLVNGTIVSCNSNCKCDKITYTPVCDRSTDTSYFSPCHAGCKTFDEKRNAYTDCTCNNALFSAKRSTSAKDFFLKSIASNQSVVKSEIKPTEKQITLYEIYDEDLKLNKPPHDDDQIINENDLYEDSYEDSVENTSKTDLVAEDVNLRTRRETYAENVVTPGACIGDCTFDYYAFSMISMVSNFLGSTGRIGNILLNFR